MNLFIGEFMKIMTAGMGFVSDHLSYSKINERFDFSSKQIESVIDIYKPDVIINCVGKTGRPNIDWCELNKEETAITNIAFPILLAEVCAKKSIHLIHIGSGCIYFGNSHNSKGWNEEDFANPKSFYSKTKYACDLAIGNMNHVSILRIRMPISTHNNQRNLINKLKGYNKIIDIENSMTFMTDLVRCIDWVAKTSQTGIFNVVNPQPLTAVKIMQEYQKYVPSHTFSIISENELDELTIAKRSNCILDSSKLNKAGFYMTPSEISLKDCMSAYFKNI